MKQIDAPDFSLMWHALAKRWGISEHYWFPLASDVDPPDTLAFFSPHFERSLGSEFIRTVLFSSGVAHLIEFREGGDAAFLPMQEAIFEYTGLEAFWSAPPFDWIVYCSHESSTTLGGLKLIEPLKRQWAAWEKSVWRTPFEKDYV